MAGTHSLILSDLQPFEEATLDLSQAGVPTLPMVLPLYDSAERSLMQNLSVVRNDSTGDTYNLAAAIDAGLEKLRTYRNIAVTKSHFPLLGAGEFTILHLFTIADFGS